MSAKKKRSVFPLGLSLVLIVAFTLSGCGIFPRLPLPADLGGQKNNMAQALGNNDGGGIDVETPDASPFVLYPLKGQSSERLPDKRVTNLHLSEISLYDGLRLLLEGTGIALSFEGGQTQGNRYQVTMINGLEGSLPDVVEKLSKAFGFFYHFGNGVLTVIPEAPFALELPPVLHDDSLASLTNTLQFIGAKDVYLDRNSRILTFVTNRQRLDTIAQFIDRIRETRSMLIYDLALYQVDLTDGDQTGITWNKFNFSGNPSGNPLNLNFSGGQSSSSNRASGGFDLGLVFNNKNFALDALVNFLKTQGTVRTVSQPRIVIMSGSKGKIRMGQSTNYVSKVGTNTGTALNQTTVETANLQTGLDLSVYGDLHDGTVYTKLSISLTDLIQFNHFTALGTDLTLPQTADRTYNSTVRALPGDTILLGGLILEKNTSNISGLPASESSVVLGNRQLSLSRSELVLVLKARVVRFAKKGGAPQLAAMKEISVEPPKPGEGSSGEKPNAKKPAAPVQEEKP